jgi:hypothetical protein
VLELLERLDVDTRGLPGCAAFGLPDGSLTSAVDLVQVLVGRLTAVQAMLVREVDGRGLVKAAGSANASTWLRDRVRISIHDAHRVTRLGATLDARPVLAAAVAAGGVTPEQAVVIGAALGEIPADAGVAVVASAEALLVDHASRFEPQVLRQLGGRILAHVDPELHDRILRKRLDNDDRLAARDRHLTLSRDGLGRTRLSGILDTVSAATVMAALSPLMVPVPAGSAGGADLRTPGARRADALVEVCRLALRTGELPADGGQPPQVNVTIDYAALAASVGVGTLDTGEPLSAAAVRRMACDARILPVVLDGAGVPVDVGRARRLFTGAARVAVVLRDRGCAFPGCDRPPKWCDIHHIVSWVDGGSTDRDNGVALCGFHHRLIHHDAWTVMLGPDRRPTFTPPIEIDPEQQPRRNIYHSRT